MVPLYRVSTRRRFLCNMQRWSMEDFLSVNKYPRIIKKSDDEWLLNPVCCMYFVSVQDTHVF